MADLSRNCKGFLARESVQSRSCDRITRAGDGRWPRYQAKSLACPICVLLIYGIRIDLDPRSRVASPNILIRDSEGRLVQTGAMRVSKDSGYTYTSG